MALIEPILSAARDGNPYQIIISTPELTNESKAIEVSNSRIYTEILAMTSVYDTFSAGYMGESSVAYIAAMQTFYGKAKNLSLIQTETALTLFMTGQTVECLNQEAHIKATTVGGLSE